MKWYIEESCGNSPKNQMLVDWVRDFVDGKDCSHFLKEDSFIHFEGKDLPISVFSIPADMEAIHLETAITHGKTGGIRGQATTGKRIYLFALFFEFTLGKQPTLNKVHCIVQSSAS